MATPVITDSNTKTTTTDTLVINVPTTTAGHLLVAVIAAEGYPVTISPVETGWTELTPGTSWNLGPDKGELAVFVRQSTGGSEPVSYSFTNTQNNMVGWLGNVSGGDVYSPEDGYNVTDDQDSVTINHGSFSTSRNGCLVFACTGTYDTPTHTPPSTYTEKADLSTNNVSLGIAVKSQATAGTVAAVTSGISYAFPAGSRHFAIGPLQAPVITDFNTATATFPPISIVVPVTNVGDTLVAVVASESINLTTPVETGWTELTPQSWWEEGSDEGRMAVFIRKSTGGSEPVSYGFDTNKGDMVGWMGNVSGADSEDGYNVTDDQLSTTINHGSFTALKDNCLVFACTGAYGSPTHTPPSIYTEKADVSISGASLGIAVKSQATSGTVAATTSGISFINPAGSRHFAISPTAVVSRRRRGIRHVFPALKRRDRKFI